MNIFFCKHKARPVHSIWSNPTNFYNFEHCLGVSCIPVYVCMIVNSLYSMWVCGCVAGLHFCSYVHVCGHIWACTACWGHPVHKQVTLWTLIIYKWSTFISHWVNNSEGGREGELCTCMPLFPEATSKRKILDWSQTVFANYCNHCLISASIQFILYCQARCQHTNLPWFVLQQR